MLIADQTETRLVLRRPAEPPSWYHLAPYAVAVVVALGIFAVMARVKVERPALRMLGVISAVTVSGGLILVGIREDWNNAEVLCTFDKSAKIIELKRISRRLQRTRRFPLEDFRGLDLKQTVTPEAMDRFAIRVRLRDGSRVKLPDSISNDEQMRAMAAIEAFLK